MLANIEYKALLELLVLIPSNLLYLPKHCLYWC